MVPVAAAPLVDYETNDSQALRVYAYHDYLQVLMRDET